MTDPAVLTGAAAVAALVISAGAMAFTARSSSANVRSATASETSANTAQEAVEIARAIQHREDAPTFELAAGPPHQGVFPIRVKRLTGPPSVIVSAVCIGETFAAPDANGVRSGAPMYHEGNSRGELINGEEFFVYAPGVANAASGNFKVYLLSEEPGDKPRQWHRVERVEWPHPAGETRVDQ